MKLLTKKTAIKISIAFAIIYIVCLFFQAFRHPVNPVWQSAAFAMAVMFSIYSRIEQEAEKKHMSK